MLLDRSADFSFTEEAPAVSFFPPPRTARDESTFHLFDLRTTTLLSHAKIWTWAWMRTEKEEEQETN